MLHVPSMEGLGLCRRAGSSAIDVEVLRLFRYFQLRYEIKAVAYLRVPDSEGVFDGAAVHCFVGADNWIEPRVPVYDPYSIRMPELANHVAISSTRLAVEAVPLWILLAQRKNVCNDPVSERVVNHTELLCS